MQSSKSGSPTAGIGVYKSDLENNISRLNNAFKKYKMNINIDKTDTLVVEKN